ncbi:MAG: hypothetical protein ACXWVD_00460 [Telluria sp.]
MNVQRGCRVVRGDMPPDDMRALLGSWANKGDDWVYDELLASTLGVMMVIGPSAAAMAWRRELGLSDVKEKAA